MSVAREEARLRRMIERILVVSLAIPVLCGGAIAACSAGTSTDTARSGPSSGGSTTGSGGESPAPDASDAPVSDGCESKTVQVDAGDDGSCSEFLEFPCGLPAGIVPNADYTPLSGCYFAYNDCQTICGGELVFNCHAYGEWCKDGGLTDAGPSIVECVDCPNGVGRRPRGLVPVRPTGRGLGDYFARAAHLEAASVVAFRTLAGELRRHGAPRALVTAAEGAACDEVRHTRLMRGLAARYRIRPPAVAVRARRQRTLAAIAIDNAVEGCVRETFGALVAAWQARRAHDADVASVMREIADDEARHAAISWAVARWAASRLEPAQSARVTRAMLRAAADLERPGRDADPQLSAVAGLPRARERRAMAQLFKREIAASAASSRLAGRRGAHAIRVAG